jgi:hypothetical protein
LDDCGPEPIEYVFCSFASIAARPTAAGAAASRARRLFRFFAMPTSMDFSGADLRS